VRFHAFVWAAGFAHHAHAVVVQLAQLWMEEGGGGGGGENLVSKGALMRIGGFLDREELSRNGGKLQACVACLPPSWPSGEQSPSNTVFPLPTY